MIVLIPAYEPDRRLVEFVAALDRLPDATVVVVDDGSGPGYDEVFLRARIAGARVERCPTNRGKGAALKHGFEVIRDGVAGEVVVCADSDGQHAVDDVVRVAAGVSATGHTVLGVRRFSGDVPLRSRFGNGLTRAMLALATRRMLVDTQTGLRGYPSELLPWLIDVPGCRYEYETRLLLEAHRAGHQVEQVDIATIYHDGNAGSHFRPVVDSIRVYLPLLAFGLVSLASFLIDAAVLLTAFAATGWLLGSVVAARAVSSTFNFVANRRVVFTDATTSLRQAAARYWALVAALLVANYLMLAALTGIGLVLLAAKVVTEVTLFLTAYAVQRLLVFRVPGRRAGRPASSSGALERRVPTVL